MAERAVFCQFATYIVSILDILTISHKYCQYLRCIVSTCQILRISPMYYQFTANTVKTLAILPPCSLDCCSAVRLRKQSKSLLINGLPLERHWRVLGTSRFSCTGTGGPLVVESYQCSVRQKTASRRPDTICLNPGLSVTAGINRKWLQEFTQKGC